MCNPLKNNGKTSKYFNPKIPGLDALLLQTGSKDKGFLYYDNSGLNMVMYGPAGVGKTILSLQIAMAAAREFQVIYLTKDTQAKVLYERMEGPFNFFQQDLKPCKRQYSSLLGIVNTEKAEMPFVFLDSALESDKKRHLLEILPQDNEIKNGCYDSSVRASTFKGKAERSDEEKRHGWELSKSPFFAFTDFEEVPSSLGRVDRYAITESVYDALGDLQPRLKPLFRRLKELKEIEWKTWEKHLEELESRIQKRKAAFEEKLADFQKKRPRELFIVCDSLSPSTIEENLRLQARFKELAENKARSKPIFLFVMESESLPTAMSVSFPPDIEICLATRHEAHDVRTRTIRLAKTRFQASLDESAPFVIFDASDQEPETAGKEQTFTRAQGEKDPWKSEKTGTTFRRSSGVEIFAPLSHEAADINSRAPAAGLSRVIRFKISELDKFTDEPELDKFSKEPGVEKFTKEPSLAGGGCTLLITQNRCGATQLGLHYLLGQIAEKEKSPNEKPPGSVLYMSFSDEFEETIKTIWSYPLLRKAILGDDSGDAKKVGKELSGIMKEIGRNSPKSRHRLYRLPLASEGSTPPGHLNIFLPDFSWITPEEAMQTVVRLFKCQIDCVLKSKQNGKSDCEGRSCLQIDRVVLDRVGRLQACWPLIQNTDIFISSLVALCNKYQIELLLVDDTAQQEEGTGRFHSRWMSMAQNVLRLRRIPFHGTETVTIELVSAGERNIRIERPYEVISGGNPGNFTAKIDVENNFSGYIGVAAGEPRRCRIKVDLSYDADNTPLCDEVYATKKNLEAAMDGVEVLLLGRGEWAGINSAFSNLSSLSRDTCHIVAIDGVWLETLLSPPTILQQFSLDDLTKLLPEELRPKMEAAKLQSLGSKQIKKIMSEHYVTRCVTTADMRLAAPSPGIFAVPMRHNWGVLAVTRLSGPHLERVMCWLLNTDDNSKGLDGALESWRKKTDKKDPHWSKFSKKIVKRILAVLLGRDQPDRENDATAKIHARIWGAGKKNPKHVLTWEDIAEFRTDTWYPFWRLLDTESLQNGRVSQKPLNPWLVLFPRIQLFGISGTSEESVVSFLLELLLASSSWEALFGDKPAALLNFAGGAKCREAFCYALELFYRLLSPRQRRQIGISIAAARADIGTGLADQVYGTEPDKNPFAKWPRQFNLLSREWITTVQNLMPRYDVRDSVHMQPLPPGSRIVRSKDKIQTFWNKVGLPELNKNCGPTIGGAWYLGVLKGGNIDLAPNVMTTILSEEMELQRMLNQCGAPVSKKLYDIDKKKSEAGPQPPLHRLPYADVMNSINKNQKQPSDPAVYFPFERTQIKNYLVASAILFDLVRHVMRIPIGHESSLCSDMDKNTDRIKLKNSIENEVDHAFDRLKDKGAATNTTHESPHAKGQTVR